MTVGPCNIFILGLLGCAAVAMADKNKPWYQATSTWYGSPEGDGSDGGACGYGPLVDRFPFKARVSAVSDQLFDNGLGCGKCYKVRCLDPSICNTRAVTVIITDRSPPAPDGSTNFDLGGAAYGRMAVAGEGGQLRNRGTLPITYSRTSCTYGKKHISYQVVEGSTEYWLGLLVIYEDGAGDVKSMHIKQTNSNVWLEMTHLWGANWCRTSGPLNGPFSVKITTSTGKSLSAKNVIPKDWIPQTTYTSHVNF